MARVVVYDACVLHPAPLRDLLIRIARAGLVRARWTDAIFDECFRSILRRRPELASPLERTRELMNAAVADCLIIGYEDLVDTVTLPDIEAKHPDDFVVELINSAPAVVLGIIARQAADLRNPPRTVDDVLVMLQAVGLRRAVARVRELFGG